MSMLLVRPSVPVLCPFNSRDEHYMRNLPRADDGYEQLLSCRCSVAVVHFSPS